ncbi:DUF3592 domain-containing protein [Leifsonia poae]|uniref:DUF3592 domain-containing protein n=1 Tax=Leifsonia poae TaxID=110933 RepID=UPI001CBB17DB|nr:DUF3592 domain-containing protein [Leifsonia poae]
MSTLDPAEFRRRKGGPKRGDPGVLTLALVAGALEFVAAAVLGYGVAWLLDGFRIVQLNSVFASWESTMPATSAVLPVGVLAGALFAVAYHRGARVFAGDGRAGLVSAATIATVGASAGIALGCALWTAPLTVGVATDPVQGADLPWGPWEWVWYSAEFWLPVLAGVVALGAVLLSIRTAVERRSRDALVGALLVSGVRVTGVVTAADAGDRSTGAYRRVPVTISFVDRSGAKRWVTRQGTFPAARVPRVGAAVTVLYDPDAPDDRARLFVAFGPGGAVADFTHHGD